MHVQADLRNELERSVGTNARQLREVDSPGQLIQR